MKRIGWMVAITLVFCAPLALAQTSLTLEKIMSAPYPENLVTAKNANRVAWTFDQEGERNIWVAEAPDFAARQLTSYAEDDGQEIGELGFSADGSSIVFVRGGDKNSAGQSPNPTSNPAGAEQDVWTISWTGGEPRKIDGGHSPQISVKGTIAYLRDGQIYTMHLGGAEKTEHVVVRGQNYSLEWSPDGSQLAFVSSRGDHSFIGLYDIAAKTVRFISPSVDRDSDPTWTMDGRRVAFIRRPAEPRDTPQGYFIQPDRPDLWAIWTADAASLSAREIWHSGAHVLDSIPEMADETGGGILHWAGNDNLVLASEQDGWQHLYSLSASGSAPKLLTPGNCEVEQWSFTPDRNALVFNSNCGDIDRRHLWTVNMEGKNLHQVASPETSSGIEWNPVVLNNGSDLVYIGSDATHAPRVFHSVLGSNHTASALATGTWPKDFPSGQLVVPEQVIFHATDGVEIHGQLFLPRRNDNANERHPALIFLHGGPVRQMLLGWHYMYYYANSYAMNEYLASRGYVVLAINYRSGIGYGRAFREAPGRAGRGATEYRDVVAAGKYLRGRSDTDEHRIGLWGGSYGGFLTAMGLGRNSELFAAGVDFHGVHDWPTDNWDGKNIPPELTKLAHESSPVTAVDTWKSPVLFIHGDDDRNVYFTQTVDLVARLRQRGVSIEQLIFPDEVHDLLRHRDWLAGYHATSDFFDRRLKEYAAASREKAH
jgi:dipeptidyl aminopeptidase/acylaminoacyl peptidase